MFTKSFAALAGVVTLASGAMAQSAANPPAFKYGTADASYPGVQSTGPNGPTNPDQPQLNTPVNQTSDSRLASLNSVDDWCTFGPAGTGEPIGNIEAETVAWCTKPRNHARVIPDGTVTAAHFVKTPLYVQLMALGDFTKIGLVAGDEGGELDPHGAEDKGNPVGGNVTSNVSGKDVHYEEWMNYVSYNQVCFRVCIAGSDQAPTKLECQHTLDKMGCNFIMPGNYNDNVFETCDGDAAYPPGLYPQADGSTSTFQQYFTGQYVANGETMQFTNGSPDQTTPQGAYSTPSTSNCQTTNTIANGIKSLAVSPSASHSTGTGKRGASPSASAGANKGSNNSTSGALTGHVVGGSVALVVAALLASIAVL